jgi:Ran GTPase-activating protein (RanGAP) involved in mRNA processing and transport
MGGTPSKEVQTVVDRMRANDPTMIRKKFTTPDYNQRMRVFESQLLARALETNTTLKKLNLQSAEVGDTGLHSFACALEKNTTLRKLKISNGSIGYSGCKRIAQALVNNSTLQELVLCPLGPQLKEPPADVFLARVLEKNTALQKMDLSAFGGLFEFCTDDFAIALEKNTVLRELNLCRCWTKVTVSGVASFARALSANTTLQVLCFSYNNLSDLAGTVQIARALAMNTTLRKLIFVYNNMGDAGAENFARALEVNTVLQELDLSNNNVGDAGAEYIARALEVNTALQELHLRCNKVGDVGLTHFARALENNTTLRKLNLNENDWCKDTWQKQQYAGVDLFARTLEKNTTLLHNFFLDSGSSRDSMKIIPELVIRNRQQFALSLETNTILQELDFSHDPPVQRKDYGEAQLARALEKNTTLKRLIVSGNALGEAGAEHFGSALEKNTTLQELDFSENYSGDAGAAKFACALEINTTLLTLNFGGNSVGDAGAEHFARALEKNTTLRKLKLNYSSIGNAGFFAFACALEKNSTLQELGLLCSRGTVLDDATLQSISSSLQRNQKAAPATAYRSRFLFDVASAAEKCSVTKLSAHADVRVHVNSDDGASAKEPLGITAERQSKAAAEVIVAVERSKYAQTLKLLEELHLEKYTQAFMCVC